MHTHKHTHAHTHTHTHQHTHTDTAQLQPAAAIYPTTSSTAASSQQQGNARGAVGESSDRKVNKECVCVCVCVCVCAHAGKLTEKKMSVKNRLTSSQYTKLKTKVCLKTVKGSVFEPANKAEKLLLV